MGHVPLSKTDDWKLEHKDQDVRGWEVRDANDRKIGKVDDMMVNTDTQYVDQIRLEDGTTYPARDIHIGDRVVYVEGVAAGAEGVQPVVKMYDDYGRVQRSESAAAAGTAATADYDDAYREHYNTTYGDLGHDYDVYEPAYRHGHESALDKRYEGRAYEDVETDLNRSYTERYPESRYDQVKDAVRHGYERARTGRGQRAR